MNQGPGCYAASQGYEVDVFLREYLRAPGALPGIIYPSMAAIVYEKEGIV